MRVAFIENQVSSQSESVYLRIPYISEGASSEFFWILTSQRHGKGLRVTNQSDGISAG